MTVIAAVWTDRGRDLLAQHWVGDVAAVQANFFKIGEGGFIQTGAVLSITTSNPFGEPTTTDDPEPSKPV